MDNTNDYNDILTDLNSGAMYLSDEIKKFGVTKLYHKHYTSIVCQKEGITYEAFKKRVSRVKNLLGIYHYPLLMYAITADLNLDLNRCYFKKIDQTIKRDHFTESLLSPKVRQMFKDVILDSFQEHQEIKKERIRQGFMARYRNASTIHNLSMNVSVHTIFDKAIYLLFLGHSYNQRTFYPHSGTGSIEIIDDILMFWLTKCLDSTITVQRKVGKLLIASYLLFEIISLYKIETKVTTIQLKGKKVNDVEYTGIVFDNCDKLEVDSCIHQLPKQWKKFIQSTLPSILNNDSLYINDTIIISLSKVLESLLSFNFQELSKNTNFENEKIILNSNILNYSLFTCKFYTNITSDFLSTLKFFNHQLSNTPFQKQFVMISDFNDYDFLDALIPEEERFTNEKIIEKNRTEDKEKDATLVLYSATNFFKELINTTVPESNYVRVMSETELLFILKKAEVFRNNNILNEADYNDIEALIQTELNRY